MQDFIKVSQERCDSPNGFNSPDITPEFLIICLQEELGEIAGPLKKLIRGFNKREELKTIKRLKKEIAGNLEIPNAYDEHIFSDKEYLKDEWKKRLNDKLKEETADLFIYWLLWMNRHGITKADIISKFNQVNKEMGCEEFNLDPETTKIEIL